MAETDILNPNRGLNTVLGFNPNWSYASKLKLGDNMTYARPRRGPAIARETGVMGYSFDMTFVDCPWEKVLYLKRFYQQFKRGYFTVIDYDGGGRHYVGRFANAPQAVHTGNLKYTISGLTFEEVQCARMLLYPGNWPEDSYYIGALGDDLKPLVATGFTSGAGFVAQQTPSAIAAGASVNDPRSYEMYCADGDSGSFAQAEYAGWGFRMVFRKGAALGILNLYLDGVQIVEGLSLYSGAATASGTGLSSSNPPVQLINAGSAGAGTVAIIVTNVPLNAHRVKVVATGTKDADSTGLSVLYPALQVMS